MSLWDRLRRKKRLQRTDPRFDQTKPLVTVNVITYNRSELLMTRALPSVLEQTYKNLDIHVIGDGTDQETVDALATVTDPRVRFTNLPHARYDDDYFRHWGWKGCPALNYGLDNAVGEYVAALADDDEMLPRNIEILLNALIKHDVDFAYGISRTYKNGHYIQQDYGSWPPGDAAFCGGAFVYKSSLPYRYDPESINRSRAGDADLWIRMWEGGVKFHFEREVVLKYHRNFP